MVADRLPAARFLLVGDGATRPDLEALARRLDLADRVIFAGFRTDVPEVLRAIDVFVLSSFTIECFPMALLEAMAAGRPAVCTAVGGIPEMIEDGVNGYLVPPHDPRALADRLVEVLTNRGLNERMGAAARARTETEFSLAASVARVEAALEGVVERPATPAVSARSPIELAVVLDLTFVGGVEVLLLNLFARFDPEIVRPRLICLREAGPLAQDFRDAGFGVEVLDRTGRFDIGTLPRLVRSLRRHRVDAVLVTHHHRAALLLGRVAARVAGVPVNIVAAHDMDLASIGRRVLPRWAVTTLLLSDALVLLAPSQGEYLHRHEGVGNSMWSSTREVVIPNGIDVPPVPERVDRERSRATLGLGPDEFAVGIVARLSAQKAHHVLFEAVAKLARTHPRVRLMVIGGGQREHELRDLAEQLAISGQVRFMGVRRDVPQLLPGLDVSCLSSVHEGAPMIVIESMAAGLPVVATDCGSIGDMIVDGEQGFVVPVGDADAIADRLQRLADDAQLRTQLGKNGRAKVERDFQIAGTARAYEQLLAELVDHKISSRTRSRTG